MSGPWAYSKWRHGGWYVHNVRYPSGACGCVSNNYVDKKWRIACDSRPFEQQPTFKTRDDAAQAEFELVAKERLNAAAPGMLSALEFVLADQNSELDHESALILRAAIAKAKRE